MNSTTRARSAAQKTLFLLLAASFAVTAQETISPKSIRVTYVDSQETARQDGKAVNAFDGNPSTIWHTQWSSAMPAYPHEIRLDFGSTYDLSEFRYLPRQDKWTWGQIARYQLYISTNGMQWTKVKEGSFGTGKGEKKVPLASAVGRFAKLVALSELTGARYASAAEFSFLRRVAAPTLKPTVSQPEPSTSNKGSASDDKVDWLELSANASGRRYLVSSEAQFNAASAVAQPGDVVVIRSGSYSGWRLRIPSVGTPQRPIIYMAERPGGVILSGLQQNGLLVTGDFNIIGGFKFEKCGSYFIRFVGAKHNRLTDSTVMSCGDYSAARVVELVDGADNNRIDNMIFAGNRSIGLAVALPRVGVDSYAPSVSNRIDHNIFRDAAHAPALQIGQWAGTGLKWPSSSTIVEYNEFRNISGQAVNSKSDGEVYRFNRFYQVDWEGLSLRGGNNKVVDSNYFEDVNYPIVSYGTGHRFQNNVMVRPTIGIQIPRWGEYQTDASGRTGFSPSTGDMLVAYNTIVNSSFASVELGRIWGYQQKPGWILATNLPFNIRFVNNVFTSTQGTLFRYMDGKGIVISRNLYHAAASAQLGELGLNAIEANPALSSSYRPVAGSVAINAGTPLAEVRTDASGQSRSMGGAPDIGAYEYTP